jgi:5-methylcytosine-specific restriction protein A
VGVFFAMPSKPPAHRPLGALTKRETAIQYDQFRGSSHARGYDRGWARVRNQHIKAHPLCCMCEREGRIVEATVVDHIVPIAVDPSRRLDPTNLQSLDDQCHAIKTQADRQRYGIS